MIVRCQEQFFGLYGFGAYFSAAFVVLLAICLRHFVSHYMHL